LDFSGHGRNFLIFGSELMELRSRRIGNYREINIKDACDETFGIQARAKTVADEEIQSRLSADLQRHVRFGLGHLLINGDQNGHREVVAVLIVTNQQLDDCADGHPSEFHRRAGIQSLERGIEVKNLLLSRMKKATRAKDERPSQCD